MDIAALLPPAAGDSTVSNLNQPTKPDTTKGTPPSADGQATANSVASAGLYRLILPSNQSPIGLPSTPYGGRSLHEQSHGESFLALLMERFGGQGLYILDEP